MCETCVFQYLLMAFVHALPTLLSGEFINDSWKDVFFLFYADRKPNLTKNLKKVARVASKLTQRHKDSVVSDITGCD